MNKQQFNIYLPPDLIKRIKHRSIDAGDSLSVFVERVLSAYLEEQRPAISLEGDANMLSLIPIIYVSDMQRALKYYRALGCVVKTESPMWSELRLGEASLALHAMEEVPEDSRRLSLAMTSHEPLENVIAKLEEAGISLARGLADEAFGRSIVTRDPDGLAIQINEHDPELYS